MKIETYVLSFVVLVIVISSIIAGIALADQNASPTLTYKNTYLNSSSRLNLVGYYDNSLFVVKSGYLASEYSLKRYDTNFHLQASYTATSAQWREVYTPFVHDGVIYVVGTNNGYTTGIIHTFNESTLAQIHYYNDTKESGNYINTIYDPVTNNLLFGCDMNTDTTKYGIFKVNEAQITNDSAYQLITVGTNPDGVSSESHVIIFKGVYYVLVTSPNSGGTVTIRTRLYSSTNLAQWTMVWEKTTPKTGLSYFAHIDASSDYLVAGVVAAQTYRIEYTTDGINWLEHNIGISIPDYPEEQPNISATQYPDVFLYEISHRDDAKGQPMSLYTFNCSQNSFKFQVNSPNGGFTFDPSPHDASGVFYVPACEVVSAVTRSEIQTYNLTLSAPIQSISVTTDRARYVKWSYVAINVTASDAQSGAPIQGASINATVYDIHGRAIWRDPESRI